jgi:hypothetical protein
MKNSNLICIGSSQFTPSLSVSSVEYYVCQTCDDLWDLILSSQNIRHVSQVSGAVNCPSGVNQLRPIKEIPPWLNF